INCGDHVRSHDIVRPPRCPAMATVKSNGDRGFVDDLRAAAPAYMRTVIAGARDCEIEELRALVEADAEALDDYRPFATAFAEDAPAAEQMDRAVASLSLSTWRPTA